MQVLHRRTNILTNSLSLTESINQPKLYYFLNCNIKIFDSKYIFRKGATVMNPCAKKGPNISHCSPFSVSLGTPGDGRYPPFVVETMTGQPCLRMRVLILANWVLK